MDNPTSTPINNQSSNSNSPSSSTEQKSSTQPNNQVQKNVGGDQKNTTKSSEVVKENKDITAG